MLGSLSAWVAPEELATPLMYIDASETVTAIGVAVQKHHGGDGYVKDYSITYSMARTSRSVAFAENEAGGPLFQGPAPGGAPDAFAFAWFKEPVAARYFGVQAIMAE
jgi:hypothetical protein